MQVDQLEGKALQASKPPEDAKIIAFEGAVRSSKTISSLLMWCKFLREGPQGAQALVGRTETSAINNVVLPLQDMLGATRVVINRGLGIVTILGRQVSIYGANDAAAYTKIQGMTLAGAYVDEAAVIAESFFNMLYSRLSVADSRLFLTCNPEGPKHWLLKNWLSRAEWHLKRDGTLHHYEEWADDPDAEDGRRPKHLPMWRVTFLLEDNHALRRNNPRFYGELMSAWPKGSMFYRRYIRSEWVSADGAIYGMWDERRMVIDTGQVPRGVRALMVGVDYGSTHPTRGYLIGIGAGPDRVTRLYVLEEWAPPESTVGEHGRLYELWLAKVTQAWGAPLWTAVDPAAKGFRSELFERELENVMRAHNSVLAGIQTVQSVLYSGHLLVVGENCPKLVEMLPGYMWDTKATERGSTQPVKDNDDEVDALRYGVYTSRRYWRDSIPLAPIATADEEDVAA